MTVLNPEEQEERSAPEYRIVIDVRRDGPEDHTIDLAVDAVNRPGNIELIGVLAVAQRMLIGR